MGESVPKRSPARMKLRHQGEISEQLEQCERIVREANNPGSTLAISPEVLRNAQLKLARFEHLYYSMALKHYTSPEEFKLAIAIDPPSPSDLIGKAAHVETQGKQNK